MFYGFTGVAVSLVTYLFTDSHSPQTRDFLYFQLWLQAHSAHELARQIDFLVSNFAGAIFVP